jgi:hypothetical protein
VLHLRADDNSSIYIFSSVRKILECIILFRVLRIGAFLREIKAVIVFEKTIKHLMRTIISLSLVLYTVYIIFAEIGVLWFGGWINKASIITIMEIDQD